MKRNTQLPGQDAGENARRIREVLGSELDKRQGQLGKINAAIGRGEGYLRKVARGSTSITVDLLLASLQTMGIDAGRFFANALQTRVHKEAVLEELERFGEIHPRLERIKEATARLEASEPPAPAPEPVDVEAMLAGFLECRGTEQRRRLGHAEKYRHPAFAAAYLEHLDALRYDDPKEARQNAEAVAVRLVPRLPGPQSERLALQLEAIGVYASALRQVGRFAMAARALRGALAVARRYGLRQCLAELLQRAAYVLSSHARHTDAMELLDEALAICFDLGSEVGLGRVQVDRGIQRFYLGEVRPAMAALEQALELLHGDSPRDSRNRLVAHQALAHCLHKLGDLEGAEAAAARAVAESKRAGQLYRAYLLWDHGSLALERDACEVAEKRLREAFELFGGTRDPNRALVALDLTKALVAQGKALEAVALAASMTEYLTAYHGNRYAEAAVSELVRTAVEGRLSLAAIERAREELRKARDPAARKPPRKRTS